MLIIQNNNYINQKNKNKIREYYYLEVKNKNKNQLNNILNINKSNYINNNSFNK